MFRVSKEIDFCYGHRLLNYDGKCRYLHGHNGRLEVTLETEFLDETGFVRDFGDVKEIVKSWVDAELDHKMLLCKDDPVLPVLRQRDEPVYVMDVNPTAENIAHLIFDYAASRGLPVVEVKLWETPTSCAVYRGNRKGA
ncbi:MAG: 6-pyruvoyl tetrahydropterin synthase family protein [Nitrospinota bacterium]